MNALNVTVSIIWPMATVLLDASLRAEDIKIDFTDL